MLERRKDDSESMGKYQAMLVSAVIATVIVFMAPTLIVVISGTEIPAGMDADDVLFAPPKTDMCVLAGETAPPGYTSTGETCGSGGIIYEKDLLPGDFAGRLQGLFGLLLFIVRIVIVGMIFVSVAMLYVKPSESTKH